MIKFKGIKRFLLRNSTCSLKERKGGYTYYFNAENNMYAYESASGNVIGFYIKKRIIQEKEDDIVVCIMRDAKDQVYIAMTDKNEDCNSISVNSTKREIIRTYDPGFNRWEQINLNHMVKTLGVATREHKIVLDNGDEELEIELTKQEWKTLLENEKLNAIKLNLNRVKKIF